MRLNLFLTRNTKIVPFDYQHYLVGTFHKWLKWNKIHDELSLYSLSWLQGGKMVNNGLDFPNGAIWFISFWDENIGKKIIASAMKDNNICCGMEVKEIQIQEAPHFGTRERFILSSPVFIRKYNDNRKADHLTYKDKDVDYYLTETMKRKLKNANLDYRIKISFDKNYPKPKTKLVKIKGIENKASFCPVIIEGDSEAIRFAWNVGIGHSTGSGFGALY